ncbi:MAG: glycoside hydrolase family 3 protein [Treponema sp.]|nr:glycoside hydrolase family 3 protein [Candidatus Treponema equifaecale]
MKKANFLKITIYFLLLASVQLITISCQKKPTPEQLEQQRQAQIQHAKDLALENYVSSLSDDVKLSQLFLVNIEGNQTFKNIEKTSALYDDSSEKPLVPGGALLFSYNISKDPLETADFIKSIRDFYIQNDNIPPYIAIDQEGGDVNRLRGLTSVLWSQKKISETFTPEKARELYSAQAKQMAQLGIHMNLAPVIEVENESNKNFLDTRTFGNLQNVLSFGKSEITAFEENNIATVLKHFPGNSSTDPHTGLPELNLSKSELEEQYFAPFKALLPYSSAVLMSHARVHSEGIEEKSPSCLSKYWVTDMVRDQFGFEGLVLSDDIFMGALADNGFPPETAAIQAVEAGVDVIMLSEKRFSSVAKIFLKKMKQDESFANKINQAVKRVIQYKIKANILNLKELPPESTTDTKPVIPPESTTDTKSVIPPESAKTTKPVISPESAKATKPVISTGAAGGVEKSIPQFAITTNSNYNEFNLFEFNKAYSEAMKLYE